MMKYSINFQIISISYFRRTLKDPILTTLNESWYPIGSYIITIVVSVI